MRLHRDGRWVLKVRVLQQEKLSLSDVKLQGGAGAGVGQVVGEPLRAVLHLGAGAHAGGRAVLTAVSMSLPRQPGHRTWDHPQAPMASP